METKKTLSVVINNYNNETLLKKCVESLLSQSLIPNEIIIVDDCSTDNSRSIITSFAHQYPKLITPCLLEKRSDIRFGRNFGLQRASSEYITFIDSDDYFISKDALASMLNLASEKVAGFGHFKKMTNTGKILYQYSGKPLTFSRKRHAIPFILSEFDMRTFPRNYVVSRKTAQESGGFDFPFDFNEDIDFLLKMLMIGVEFRNVGFYTAAYVDTGNGLSKERKALLKPTLRELKSRYFQRSTMTEKILAAHESVADVY
jgi:glycosyltransferase involved in cell wall biosynthesis